MNKKEGGYGDDGEIWRQLLFSKTSQGFSATHNEFMTWKSLKNFLFAIIAQKKKNIKTFKSKNFSLPKAQEKSNEEKLLIYERSYKFRA